MAGLILFPSSLLNDRVVDEAFEAERDAARQAGLVVALLDAMALEEKAFDRAVRRVPAARQAIYRGWMLTAETYAQLHVALARRGSEMLTSPEAYRYAHHLPESYPDIREHTPRTVWTSTTADLATTLKPFENSPVIVKDYVKSQKHYWHEACFIPDASDTEAALRVATRFAGLQAESFTGGFVFREFVELAPLATHEKSGMPLALEFRLFFMDGQLLATAPYWESGDYASIAPPVSRFVEIARKVRSRFFTMDIAKRRDSNDWLILEVGDGQVSGIPERLPVQDFYLALSARLGKA